MKHERDAGFSLAALIFFLTAISIALSVAVPAYQMQAQRERELELVFRGEEYVRAIQKYQRRFRVNPPTVQALLATNGRPFLRRQYKHPITDKDFRLIFRNPDGTLSGSVLLNQRIGNTPLFGSTPPVFGQSPSPGGQPGAFGSGP